MERKGLKTTTYSLDWETVIKLKTYPINKSKYLISSHKDILQITKDSRINASPLFSTL
jgi:hypothetical protein